MNLSEKITSIFVGGALVGLFTALLVFGKISPAVYNTLVIAAMLLSIAIAALPRLQEFNLRDMKLLLAKAEKVTAELKEMYGDVEHLKVTPLRMDDTAYSELGLGDGGGLVHGSSVVNYVMGCMKRERERLARVFITGRSGDELARAVVDPSLDMKVFKWVGPGIRLDDQWPSNAATATATQSGQSAPPSTS